MKQPTKRPPTKGKISGRPKPHVVRTVGGRVIDVDSRGIPHVRKAPGRSLGLRKARKA